MREDNRALFEVKGESLKFWPMGLSLPFSFLPLALLVTALFESLKYHQPFTSFPFSCVKRLALQMKIAQWSQDDWYGMRTITCLFLSYKILTFSAIWQSWLLDTIINEWTSFTKEVVKYCLNCFLQEYSHAISIGSFLQWNSLQLIYSKLILSLSSILT